MVDFVLLKVYISGNALVILGGPHDLIQTIYHDNAGALDAVAIDEVSGKIGTCTNEELYIYRPYGRIEGALKVATSTRTISQDPDGAIVVPPVHTTDHRGRKRHVYTIMGIGRRVVGRVFFAETLSNNR